MSESGSGAASPSPVHKCFRNMHVGLDNPSMCNCCTVAVCGPQIVVASFWGFGDDALRADENVEGKR